jgi:hypothetical protein
MQKITQILTLCMSCVVCMYMFACVNVSMYAKKAFMTKENYVCNYFQLSLLLFWINEKYVSTNWIAFIIIFFVCLCRVCAMQGKILLFSILEHIFNNQKIMKQNPSSPANNGKKIHGFFNEYYLFLFLITCVFPTWWTNCCVL